MPKTTKTALRAPARILIVIAVLALSACAAQQPRKSPDHYQATGMASYYAHRFHGRPTASGEIYNEKQLTAAHPWLPFGSRVKVTNLTNGREIEVRINDRGPFANGRIIDLSYAAAQKLNMIRQGVAKVRVVAVE